MNVQRIEVIIKVGDKEKVVNIEGDPVASNTGELCVILDNIIRPKNTAKYTYELVD